MSRGDDLHRDEIPPGTLYMLILKTLARSGQLHGYEIANSIQQISDDVLQVEEGSLYPALQRMLIKGWVTAKWGVTAENRRARYYELTITGRQQFAADLDEEVRLHLELRREQQLQSGVREEDAGAAACRRFGNASYLKEESR